MNFRHLQSWEKKKSLPLYEEAFPEDQGAYAAYYYEWKSPDKSFIRMSSLIVGIRKAPAIADRCLDPMYFINIVFQKAAC